MSHTLGSIDDENLRRDDGDFSCGIGTDTVLKTKLFGLKVRHFNNFCLLIAFTRSIHALFSM